MTRKSKQSGGHMPLTHYERTKKFASSEYGTTSKRLAGHSQYQLGDCALSLTRLDNVALCSPSGYLYDDDAILQYMVTKTQEIKEREQAYERQQQEEQEEEGDSTAAVATGASGPAAVALLGDGGGKAGGQLVVASAAAGAASTAKKRRHQQQQAVADFEESQKLVKKSKAVDSKKVALDDLKRTSYWLADSQPKQAEKKVEKSMYDRPVSPHTQTPLRRKDLWPVQLKWEHDKLVCAVSGKSLKSSNVVAYWTDKKCKDNGVIVLQSVYDELVVNEAANKRDNHVCPITSKKIRHTRTLQKSGTSFAASGQQVQVAKYAPTIT